MPRRPAQGKGYLSALCVAVTVAEVAEESRGSFLFMLPTLIAQLPVSPQLCHFVKSVPATCFSMLQGLSLSQPLPGQPHAFFWTCSSGAKQQIS